MAPKKADPKKDAKSQPKKEKGGSSGGGKQKKKKWSKGKNKEKVNNAILFDKTSYEKMLTEVPKFKMITVSILSDRLRINCSLARRALAVLVVRCHTERALLLQCAATAPRASTPCGCHGRVEPRARRAHPACSGVAAGSGHAARARPKP
jgi:small subunit ribosomal protein S25e